MIPAYPSRPDFTPDGELRLGSDEELSRPAPRSAACAVDQSTAQLVIRFPRGVLPGVLPAPSAVLGPYPFRCDNVACPGPRHWQGRDWCGLTGAEIPRGTPT